MWEEGSDWENDFEVAWKCWTHIKHLFCWRMTFWYRNCNMCWEHQLLSAYFCRKKLRIFDKALFDFLGRVANASLEEDVWWQTRFPVSFSGLGCRRARDIALPSFLASINSAGEFVDTNFERIVLELTYRTLTNLQREWGLGCGIVYVLPRPMTQDVRKHGTFLLFMRNWDIMVRETDYMSIARLLVTAQKDSGIWLNTLQVSSLRTTLDHCP